MNRLIALLLCLGAATGALARTHTVWPAQYLLSPDASYEFFGMAAAIDSDSIVTLADRPGGRVALLYRRNASGQWNYSRTLLDVTAPPEQLRARLAMKNGIAVIQITETATIWERVAGNWVQGQTAAPILEPGNYAISGSSILAGGSGCDHDALIYQKAADGRWTVTGRIGPDAGVCNVRGLAVELNYDYALVRGANNTVRAYRKNGTALAWQSAGSFVLTGQTFSPMALQKTVAAAPGSAFFRRTGTTWNYQDQFLPADYANGTGHAFGVKYRDGVLLSTEAYGEIHAFSKVYVYVPNAAGGFDHAAILETPGYTQDFDVSGNTVVVGADDPGGGVPSLTVFTLPSPLVPPAAIANNFDARDISGFTQTPGSQFALAGNSANYLFRQSSLTVEAHALLNGSDWAGYQRIEADITPRAFDGSNRWFGLALRYTDESNFYYLTLRNTNIIELKRKLNGEILTLAQASLPIALNARRHVMMVASSDGLSVSIDGVRLLTSHDAQLMHGRAALMTFRTSADFDNVYVSPTAPINLMYKDYPFYWYDWGRHFTELGGHWEITGQEDPEGLSQTDTSGSAFALNGSITDDQVISAHIRLDSFTGSTSQVASYGLLARYVDPQNYYYLSIRSSNQLQIRKLVNGVITVLKAVSFTAVPGQMREFTLSVLGNELHVEVDGVRVATAIDNDLPRGIYGMSTYRTAATWQDISVEQP